MQLRDFPDRQYAQYAVALAYYQFNDYKHAIKIGKEIESLFPVKNHISVFTIDMIGCATLRTKQYDSAIAQFEWILDNINVANRPIAWTGIVSGNIGYAYFLQGQYDVALPYLERAVNLTTDENIPDNTADFASYLSTIYLAQKNTALAKKNLEIAQLAAMRSNSVANYYNVYKAFADYYKHIGDSAQALVCLDSSIIFKDSLTKLLDVNLKYQGEVAAEEDRKLLHEKTIAKQGFNQQITKTSLFIFIALVLAAFFVYYLRILRKNKKREQQILVERLQAETQLVDINKSILEKDEEIERINAAFQQLQEQKPGIISPNTTGKADPPIY